MFLAKVGALELSFIILLLFMLGLSGLIAAVVVIRIVEPAGLKALTQRLFGFPRPKRKRTAA